MLTYLYRYLVDQIPLFFFYRVGSSQHLQARQGRNSMFHITVKESHFIEVKVTQAASGRAWFRTGFFSLGSINTLGWRTLCGGGLFCAL